jgi:hypothetical protein
VTVLDLVPFVCQRCERPGLRSPQGGRRKWCDTCRQTRTCTHCLETFTAVADENTCGEPCRLARRRIGFAVAEQVLQSRIRTDPCLGCGFPVNRPGSARFCETCADLRVRAGWAAKGRRRQKAAVGFRPVTLLELAVREGWRCHLCRRPVLARLVWPHPGCATRDHLIPLADGGTDDPANLGLAHHRCNMARGAGGVVQLRLVA